LKFEENKKKLIEMYKYYEKYGIRYMKYKFPKFHTTSFLEKCSKYGIIDYSPSKSTKKMKIMYRGCEYGLNELVKILGVCKYYNKIVSLHSKCNMKYEDIFKSIDDGTFVELKVLDKNNENVENKCEFMKFLKNKFIGCIVYDFEYVHMCEMDIDGC